MVSSANRDSGGRSSGGCSYNGLDQGDPLSVILYIIYNTPLLCIRLPPRRAAMLLFVDDVAVVTSGPTFANTHAQLTDIMEKEGGVLEWARLHNCSFGVEKFQLLDASRRRNLLRTPLVLGQQSIASQTSAKFLGVIVDNQLRWKEQGAAALRKGQAWVGQICRLSQVTKGVSRAHMRRLYLAIAVPRMLYAADIFLTPQTRRTVSRTAQKSGRAIITKLATIQRRAAIAITGGLRSSPTYLLDALAGLLPFHILVDQHRLQAALRLAALPKTHALHAAVKSAATRFVRHHPSPLHFLMAELREKHVHPLRIEKISAVRQHSKWTTNIKISIPDSKEEAAAEVEDDETAVVVFSDGSGLNGQVGAAAVLFRNGTEVRQGRAHLGSLRRHTVYEGESAGALIGVALLARERTVLQAATICIDSQAAIRATISTRPVPGHYFMDALHADLAVLRRRHRHLQLLVRWVPGHVDVAGNEAADKAARAAAAGDTSSLRRLPQLLRSPLPHSKAAARQRYRASIKRAARKVWSRSPRYEHTNLLAPDVLLSPYQHALSSLPRKHMSLITQLITGHIPLAAFLHKIGAEDSPTCPCCHESPETIAHFVIHCPVHRLARAAMFAGLHPTACNLTTLLSSPKNHPRLLTFIARTDRLRSVYGRIAEINAATAATATSA